MREQEASRWLTRWWDFLAVPLVMLASLPEEWLSRRAVTLVPNPGFIDDNWHLDLIFKATRGIWIGRDVAFTHGPLFEWLSSLPSRFAGLSMGAAYASWNTLPLWCAALFLLLSLRLLIPREPPWKRFLLVLLLCMFWGPSFRTAFGVLAFAIFLRGWFSPRAYLSGCAASVTCAIAFLVSADQGIYALASLAITLAAVAIEQREFRRLVQALAAMAACSAVLVVALNAFFAKAFDFRFWKDAFAQTSVYRWATPFPMAADGEVYLAATLIGGTAIFTLRTFTRGKGRAAVAQNTAFLISAFAFSLAAMQSGLVRADAGHVAAGCFSMIFFAGVILFSFEPANLSMAAVGAALAGSALLGTAAISPANVAGLYRGLRYPVTACPEDFAEFDRVCYSRAFAAQVRAASSYLDAHARENDSIIVFPYQTMFGIASRRDIAGGLMQPYTASGEEMARAEIVGLERAAAPAALYLPDLDRDHFSNAEAARRRALNLSLPVDGVANFTRVPQVWLWLMRHYRLDREVSNGVFGLLRDDSRAERISITSRPLELPARTYAITQRSSETDLGRPLWPLDADFLRLRLAVRHGALWTLRKPERMEMEITRADGSRAVERFLLPPNEPAYVWIYPWKAADLAQYFDADETRWRSGLRPAIIRLRLIATPLDWVSETPDSISLEAADGVTVTMSARH